MVGQNGNASLFCQAVLRFAIPATLCIPNMKTPRCRKFAIRRRGVRMSWCPRRDSNSHTFRQRFLRPSCLPFHHSGASRYFTKRPGNRQDRFRARRRVFVASACAKGYPFKSKQYLTLKGSERARNGMEPVYRRYPGRRACSCRIRGISRLSFVDGKGRMSRGRLLFENEDATQESSRGRFFLRFEHRLADRRSRRTRKRALRAFRRQVGRTCDNGPDSFAGRPAGQCA